MFNPIAIMSQWEIRVHKMNTVWCVCVCGCVSFLSPGRLPKNQECHEMWSRKKRKKEAAAAAAAAGGGAKEGTGSSNGSGPNPGKQQLLSDLSRSRSQSGSPMKEQQRGGSVGPRGEPSLSLANGSLPPKPQSLPQSQPVPLASQQQQQTHNITPTAAVVPPPVNMKQYPPNQNQNHPIIPPQGGTALPPQLQQPPPIDNPPTIAAQLGGEAVLPGGGGGGGGIQVKQAHKTLANPNIKPSLTVPLPTVPLSASILESLHEASSGSQGEGSSSQSAAAAAAVAAAVQEGVMAVNAEQSQPKDSANSVGTVAPAGGGEGGGGVMASSAAASQQLQQVIDAQRTLLSQITQLVTEQKRRTNPQQDPGGGGGGIVRGNTDIVTPGHGGYSQKNTSGIASRTQTFDYGNRSNKVLESAAVHQLEQEYYQGDPNATRWS